MTNIDGIRFWGKNIIKHTRFILGDGTHSSVQFNSDLFSLVQRFSAELNSVIIVIKE